MAKLTKTDFRSQLVNRGMQYTHIPANATMLDQHTILAKSRWNKPRTARRSDITVRVPVVLVNNTTTKRYQFLATLSIIAPQEVTAVEHEKAIAAIKEYLGADPIWDGVRNGQFNVLA